MFKLEKSVSEFSANSTYKGIGISSGFGELLIYLKKEILSFSESQPTES